jgi:hypothetical protein
MGQALIRNDVMAGAGPLADQSAVSSGDGDSHSGVVGEVGAFYWTVLAPDIVNPGREERVSIQL